MLASILGHVILGCFDAFCTQLSPFIVILAKDNPLYSSSLLHLQRANDWANTRLWDIPCYLSVALTTRGRKCRWVAALQDL